MRRIALALLLVLPCFGQVPTMKYVSITGNSIAQMQGGFQRNEFPVLLPANVTIRGMYSYTCDHLFPLVTYLVPANTNVVVLYDSTNDVLHGVAVSDHIACMERTVAALVLRNPTIRVIVANTPPWTADNCYGDYRDAIDVYNSAYASEPWPANVRVVDVWTPNVLQDGSRWADPNDMTGACGIHPGPANQWTDSWSHFTAPVSQAVMAVPR